MKRTLSFVPYLADAFVLDDNNFHHRHIAAENCKRIVRHNIVNELWLYGDKISDEMKDLCRICKIKEVPIVPRNLTTYHEWEILKNSKF